MNTDFFVCSSVRYRANLAYLANIERENFRQDLEAAACDKDFLKDLKRTEKDFARLDRESDKRADW